MDEAILFSPITIQTPSGFVSFAHLDFPLAVGGIRMEPGVTLNETEKLAISMSLKLATYQLPFSGAKAGISNEPYDKDMLDKFIGEIAPLLTGIKISDLNEQEWRLNRIPQKTSTDELQFVTGPDMGTSEEDFLDSLKNNGMEHIAREGLLSKESEKYTLPLDNVLTGYGVVVALEETFRSLRTLEKNKDPLVGRTYSLEGFGKVASGIATLLKDRCQLKAFSNRYGTVIASQESPFCENGAFIVDELIPLLRKKGDSFIFDLGLDIHPQESLFAVNCDFSVPGTRVEKVDLSIAKRLSKAEVKAVVPSANYPFTTEGRRWLEENGIIVIPDFVANAGAVIAAMLEFTTRSFDDPLEEIALDLVHAAVSNEMKELFLDAVACGCRIGEKVIDNERSIYDISVERSVSKLRFMRETISKEEAKNLPQIADDFIQRTLMGTFL